jgi:WhiB family transcriptional regulator, redox-sensing transcriptional regulator
MERTGTQFFDEGAHTKGQIESIRANEPDELRPNGNIIEEPGASTPIVPLNFSLSTIQELGVCRGSAVNFLPQRGEDDRPAKKVCNGSAAAPKCPIRDACLGYALQNKSLKGVWGGTSERERNKLRKQHK